MALHGVQNPAATAYYVPHPVALNRAVAGDSATPQPPISQKAERQQNSYAQTGNGGPNANPSDVNHAAAVAQGGQASPVSDASAAPASTQQAPDASSIAGVPTYNYHGQLNAVHPDAGRALHVSA